LNDAFGPATEVPRLLRDAAIERVEKF